MSRATSNDVPIAVVGLGCRFPGADSLDAYWRLIHEGRSGITVLPPEKMDRALYFDPEPGKLGRSYTEIGGVVPFRPLDPAICDLPSRLVDNADAAHLVMCEVAAMALRHAGYDPFNLKHRKAGVYVGHSGGSELAGEMCFHTYSEQAVQVLRKDKTFQKLPAHLQAAAVQGVVRRIHSTTASRRADGGPELAASNVSALISQAFGLNGPALATDAACASSLIAMAMGIHALRHGHIDMAVVGGASCSKWYALVLFSQAQSISGTGSRPFDANADGLISSDGYAAVVLKTLPKALADGDHIRAVIRGIGVSSDGRGKSLWAPRKEGQILAVGRAYGEGVDPAWLQYIECHATSTQVGDSTELGALRLALKDRLPSDRKLPIGSVKANIGHTLESAGIAGFVKTVLCMEHNEIPGQINFKTPNPDVPWNDIPFYVPTTPQPWPEPVAGRPRRAAVNAFGIGGLNVHVVIDDRIVDATKTQVSLASPLSRGVAGASPWNDDEAIAVVGAAAILPGALTLSAFWDLLVSGKDPKTEVPADRWSTDIYYDPAARGPGRSYNKRGGFITDFVYDWKKHKVPPKQIANANPLQFMLLDAADQALRDAGYEKRPFDRQRAGVVVGSVFGGDFACDMQMGLRIPEFQKHIREELKSRGIPADQVDAVARDFQDLLLARMPALLDETGSFTASTLASRLTKTFDMMGGAFSLDASDVSSMAAIGAAIGMLQDGAVDLMLCAAGQRSMDVNVFEGLQLRNSLTPGDSKSPFATDADGILPAEGVGVLILKRLSQARKDGDRIRGVIRGLGTGFDGDDYRKAYRDSFRQALAQAGAPTSAIGLVESASIGVPALAKLEGESLSELLSEGQRPVPAVVSSVVGQIGHTLGVAGMASVLKAAVELEHGQVPASAGLQQPIREIAGRPDVLNPGQTSQTLYETVSGGRTVAAVTNNAANGAVYTLLMEGGERLPAPPRRPQVVAMPASNAGTIRRTRVWLTAASRADLKTMFAHAAQQSDRLFSQPTQPDWSSAHGVRVGIVTESAEQLARQLRFAAEHLEHSPSTFVLDDKGIFVRSTTPGKTAFLFPGQGSQYPGMLKPLIEQLPAAAEILREIDATLRASQCPTLEEMAWSTSNRLGSDVFLTQLAMLVGNLLSYRVLEREGIVPDIISCHSYGEFPALVAAGAMTLADAIQATRVRTQSVETRESTKGSLLSTTAPIELVDRILGHLRGGAYLASHNAPDQTVVGGTADAIQNTKRLLEAEGFATRTLAVPRPYHTPLLVDAQPAFARALSTVPMQAPRLRMVSSVSLSDVRTADDVRRNLVDQLTTPVRYVQLIEKLAQEGVNLFVEVGPNRVLTRLNQRILAGRSVTILPLDVPQHPGIEGLERLQTIVKLMTPEMALQAASRPAAAQPRKILFFDARSSRGRRQDTPVIPATPVVASAPAAPSIAAAVTTALTVPASAPATPGLDRAAVTKFMIGYIVDQTGYPEEMVELTADLEADLGIDSIKKAQLIGELAENFELAHLAGSLNDLSLDDFRTLDSLLDFVVGSKSSTVAVAAVETADSIVAAETVAVQASVATAVTAAPGGGLDRAAVTKFMIGYIVDQTGYPEEMVELTADLEADLGIDSIKKAQLIGELAENFELAHLAGSLNDLSLDDFRTLDSLLDFVVGSKSSTVAVATVAPANSIVAAETVAVQTSVATVVTAAPGGGLDRAAVTKFMIGYIVDQTGYPEEMVELTADLEADLGIDSIKKAQLIGELAENFELAHLAGSLNDLSLDDFRTLESLLDFVVGKGAAAPTVITTAAPTVQETVAVAHSTPAAVAVAAPASGTLDRAAVTKFMIGYIVDQTGYPEEMVELTADLEADLGIDSIKKAQLIGELAENFELAHLAGSLNDLSLDDFRTLESLLDFVVGSSLPSEGPAAAEPMTAEASEDADGGVALATEIRTVTEVGTLAEPLVALPPAASAVPEAFSVVTLQGSPYELGYSHGKQEAGAIRAIMERYAAMLGPRLQNIPELDEALAKPTMYFGESEIEELRGIADGAGLPQAAVLAHNLGMYPDYVPGCTQFAFTRASNPRYGLVHAVNEDSPLALTLPDCLSRIVQVRHPEGKIPHVTFSVSGQTGGLNGINAAGLAITSTLLLDCPRRKETAIGKVHPVIVKRLLETAETIDDAVSLLRTLDRAGAWSLCLSEFRTDRLCYLEYDGEHLEIQESPRTVLTTNHCLLQTPVADVPEHSRHRLARLEQLLADAADKGVTMEQAQLALRDRFDLGRGRQTTHATMNTIRRVDNQISIVMRPECDELYVTPGPRSGELVDTYFRLNIRDLLQSPRQTAAKSSGTNGHHVNGSAMVGLVKPAPAASNRVSVERAVAGLPADSERVVQRHVLRVVEAPLSTGAPTHPVWAGQIVVLGQNALSNALQQKVAGTGGQVHVLAADDQAVVRLQELIAKGPVAHLFVTTARDESAARLESPNWDARSSAGVLVPFAVCQAWAQHVATQKLTASATLVAVTAMGGDFGFSGHLHSFEGGGLTGLFKGLQRELAELSVKAIDAPWEESAEGLAKVVLQEAAQRGRPLEVSYIRGHRHRVQAVPQTASSQRRGRMIPHGNWVVTGGARGVTAVVARELGRRFGLQMHLLGSTPLPQIDPSWRNLSEEGMKTLKRTTMDQAKAAGKNPAATWKDLERSIEIDRTLQAFRADGINVTYHACNVADRTQLDRTLQQIRQQDGPIHGVIHGAGLEAACRFDKKKPDMVAATLAVKVNAAVHLAALLEADPLEYFVGFGSTSGRFGGMGQTDYSMASDMLCKICQDLRSRRPNVIAVGLHWPPWADVGMAARPESKIALQSSNLAFMPPLEGAAHVIDELLTAGLEGELLYLDKPDLIDSDETMPVAKVRDEYVARTQAVRRASLVDTISDLQPGVSLKARATYDPTRDPFLLEHRHQGQPILPAVVGMETMAEAAMILAADGRHITGVRNFTVHNGLRFLNEQTQTARVVARLEGSQVAARLEADFRDRHGRLVEPHRLQMDATLELNANYPTLAVQNLGPEPTSWTTHRYVVDWKTMRFPEEARVYHGYPFQALKEYSLVDRGVWARLVVPAANQIAGERPGDGWLLPSATIDATLLAADLLVWNQLHKADLPRSIGHLQLARPLVAGEALTLRGWLHESADQAMILDIVVVDARGATVLQLDRLELFEVKTGVAKGAAVPATVPETAGPATSPVVASHPSTNLRGPLPAPVPQGIKPLGSLATSFNGHASPAPLPAALPLMRGETAASKVIASAVAETAPVPTVTAERLAQLPMIDAARWETPDRLIADVRLDPLQDPFLAEHRYGGRPLLPAVVGMEIMIEAASLTESTTPERGPLIRDFTVHAPCKFRDDQSRLIRVVVERSAEGWKARLVETDARETLLQQAEFSWSAAPTGQAPAQEKGSFPFSPMQYAAPGQAVLIHGPRFQALKSLSLLRQVGWGKVKALPAENLAGTRQGRWFLPIATLDSCLVACGVDLFILMNQRVEVPHRCGEVSVNRLPHPDEACQVQLHYRGHDDAHTTYDFVLFGQQGDVILSVRGYQGVRTGRGADASLWDAEQYKP